MYPWMLPHLSRSFRPSKTLTPRARLLPPAAGWAPSPSATLSQRSRPEAPEHGIHPGDVWASELSEAQTSSPRFRELSLPLWISSQGFLSGCSRSFLVRSLAPASGIATASTPRLPCWPSREHDYSCSQVLEPETALQGCSIRGFCSSVSVPKLKDEAEETSETQRKADPSRKISSEGISPSSPTRFHEQPQSPATTSEHKPVDSREHIADSFGQESLSQSNTRTRPKKQRRAELPGGERRHGVDRHSQKKTLHAKEEQPGPGTDPAWDTIPCVKVLATCVEQAEARARNSREPRLTVEKAVRIFKRGWYSSSQAQPLALELSHIGRVMGYVSSPTVALALLKWSKGQGLELTAAEGAAYTRALGRARDHSALENLEERMRDLDVPMSHEVYNALAAAYIEAGMTDLALGVPERMAYRSNIQQDASLHKTLMGLCQAERLPRRAISLFKEAQKQGIDCPMSSYEIFLRACAQLEERTDAEMGYITMRRKGMKPSLACASAMLMIFDRSDLYSRARQLFAEVQGSGTVPSPQMYRSIINLAWRHRRQDDAERLFAQVAEKGPGWWPAWAVMVHQYGTHRGVSEALQLFQRMLNQGIEPNVGMLTSLLTNLLREERYHHSLLLIAHMVEHGPRPVLRTLLPLIKRHGSATGESKVWLSELLRATHHPAASLACWTTLEQGKENSREAVRNLKGELLGVLTGLPAEEKYYWDDQRALVHILMERLCVNGLHARALGVWETAVQCRLFQRIIDVHPDVWSKEGICKIDLRCLHVSTVDLVMSWVLLRLKEECGEIGVVPRKVGIITGSPKIKGVWVKQRVQAFVEEHGMKYEWTHGGRMVIESTELMNWLRTMQFQKCQAYMIDKPAASALDSSVPLAGVPQLRPHASLEELVRTIIDH